ncbi:hypothetical protein PoB_007642900 [Plakobranchus ocellatus]|uniref:Uncharacterized protein n=1 Tax=Plakobranchus ocellatus TaxID=259542 RepID=A0AAV4E0U7_9GAST|nr:hypothetical protein PoB_007642900 [Plakobranchus ocellatus]
MGTRLKVGQRKAVLPSESSNRAAATRTPGLLLCLRSPDSTTYQTRTQSWAGGAGSAPQRPPRAAAPPHDRTGHLAGAT